MIVIMAKEEKRTPRAQRKNDREDDRNRQQHDTRPNAGRAYCPTCHVWYDSARDSSHAGH